MSAFRRSRTNLLPEPVLPLSAGSNAMARDGVSPVRRCRYDIFKGIDTVLHRNRGNERRECGGREGCGCAMKPTPCPLVLGQEKTYLCNFVSLRKFLHLYLASLVYICITEERAPAPAQCQCRNYNFEVF